MLIHKKHYLLILLCSIFMLASCGRSSNPTSKPRSTLGDREVGSQYNKAPRSMKASKRKKGKMKTMGTTNAYVEESRKKYQKMSKDMDKPQYKDPMYFGHKKKPKKRKRGKRKFCKECGMVH